MRYLIRPHDDRVCLMHSGMNGRSKPLGKDELMHYRTKGSRNGVRLYQNKDGSLTPLGRKHYGIDHDREWYSRHAQETETSGARKETSTMPRVSGHAQTVSAPSKNKVSVSWPSSVPKDGMTPEIRRRVAQLQAEAAQQRKLKDQQAGTQTSGQAQPQGQQPASPTATRVPYGVQQQRAAASVPGAGDSVGAGARTPASGGATGTAAASNEKPKYNFQFKDQQNQPAQNTPAKTPPGILVANGGSASDVMPPKGTADQKATVDQLRDQHQGDQSLYDLNGMKKKNQLPPIGNDGGQSDQPVSDQESQQMDNSYVPPAPPAQQQPQNKGFFESVGDWFNQNIANPVGKAATNAWNGATGAVGQGADWFNQNVVNPVSSWGQQAYNDASQWVGNAVNDARQYGQGAIAGLTGNVPRDANGNVLSGKELSDQDMRNGYAAGKGINGFFGNIGQGLNNAWNGASNWIGNAVNDVGKAATDAWNGASNWIGNAVQGIGGGQPEQQASPSASQLPPGYMGTVASARTATDVGGGGRSGPQTQQQNPNFFQNVGNWFNQNIANPVGKAATDAWNGVTGAVGQGADWFNQNVVNPVSSWGQQAINTVGQGLNNAGKFIGDTATNVGQYAQGAWNGLTGTGTPIDIGYINRDAQGNEYLYTDPDQVNGYNLGRNANQFFGNVGQGLTNMWNGATGAARQAYNDASAFTQGMLGNMSPEEYRRQKTLQRTGMPNSMGAYQAGQNARHTYDRAVQDVRNYGEGAMRGLSGQLPNSTEPMSFNGYSAGTNVRNFFDNPGGWFNQNVVNPVSGAVNGAVSGVSNLLGMNGQPASPSDTPAVTKNDDEPPARATGEPYAARQARLAELRQRAEPNQNQNQNQSSARRYSTAPRQRPDGVVSALAGVGSDTRQAARPVERQYREMLDQAVQNRDRQDESRTWSRLRTAASSGDQNALNAMSTLNWYASGDHVMDRETYMELLNSGYDPRIYIPNLKIQGVNN